MGRYKVIGAMPFYGYKPGEEFEADLDEDKEARYVSRGSLQRLDGGGQPADATPENPGAEPSLNPPAPEPEANKREA